MSGVCYSPPAAPSRLAPPRRSPRWLVDAYAVTWEGVQKNPAHRAYGLAGPMTYDRSNRLVVGCCAVVVAAACSKSSYDAMPTGTEPRRVAHEGPGRAVLLWQSPSTH